MLHTPNPNYLLAKNSKLFDQMLQFLSRYPPIEVPTLDRIDKAFKQDIVQPLLVRNRFTKIGNHIMPLCHNLVPIPNI